MELLRLLGSTVLFGHLSPEQLECVAACCERQHYKQGDIIYRQNTPARKVYLILEGLVSLDDVVDSFTFISYERRGPKNIIGAASMLGLKMYSLTATCLEPTEAIAIDVPALERVCEANPGLGYKVMAEVAFIFFQRYERAKTRLYNIFKEIPLRLVYREGSSL